MQTCFRQECNFSTHSAEETRELGRDLASHLQVGDVVCLYGELGAGKTTLLQGLAEGLGVTTPATSPSFTIMQFYPGPIPLYHLDLYRLVPGDLADIGIEEILGEKAIVAVEWAERLPAPFCEQALRIAMEYGEEQEDERLIRLTWPGERGCQALEILKEQRDARSRA